MSKCKNYNRTFSEVIVPSSPAEKAYWSSLAQRAKYYRTHPEILSQKHKITLDEIESW